MFGLSPRRLRVLVLLVGIAAPLAAAPAARAEPSDVAPICAAMRVDVGVGLAVAGRPCTPAAGASALVVLVPGATYDHTYWDFPYDPQQYDVRLALNGAGYATFTLDRLGTGQSSRPPALLLTSSEQAAALHAVIAYFRRTGAFAEIVLGGHSLGSVDVVLEAATYRDEDAVLVTGLTHHPDYLELAALVADTYPAALDPATQAQGYGLTDLGYFTTRPGVRARHFYGPDYDPQVLAVDEATKSVYALAEPLDGAPLSVVLPLSARIDVPVLLADGADDPIFCPAATCAGDAGLRAAEAPYYTRSSCLSTFVLPGAGHDLNLAPDVASYEAALVRWLDATVGPSAGAAGSMCNP